MLARRQFFALLTALVLSTTVQATESQAPYAGLQSRPIKALSEAEAHDLKAGNGAGMALPAELNGYPGPRHVRSLGKDLGLSADQQSTVDALVRKMEAEAVPLGHSIIEEERALDTLFASGEADEGSLAEATDRIALLRGRLRFAHLRYHLATRDLLTPSQIAQYASIRGYNSAPTAQPRRHNHH